MKYTRPQIMLSRIRHTLNYGCGDGNCVIKKPKGMHTNGGCRCLRDLPDELLAAAVWLEVEKHQHGKPFPIPDVHTITDDDEREAFRP